MIKWYYPSVLLLTVSLVCANPAWAGEDHKQMFESELVRVADLASPPPGPIGTDPLSEGDVEVSRNRQVEVEVEGAFPSVVYTVLFCLFGNPGNCITLGTVTTNQVGEGEAELAFPATPTTLAGSFLLTRAGANQFITGFQFPPALEGGAAGVEVELKGQIQSIGANSFRLQGLPLDIFVSLVPPLTRFEGVSGFSGLVVGQRVEVKGVTVPTGILALKIEVED